MILITFRHSFFRNIMLKLLSQIKRKKSNSQVIFLEGLNWNFTLNSSSLAEEPKVVSHSGNNYTTRGMVPLRDSASQLNQNAIIWRDRPTQLLLPSSIVLVMELLHRVFYPFLFSCNKLVYCSVTPGHRGKHYCTSSTGRDRRLINNRNGVSNS